MKKSSTKVVVLLTFSYIAACTSSKPTDASRAKEFQATNENTLAVVDAPTALSAARGQGFLSDEGCGAHLKGGEEVMFTTGADNDHESGQASGLLEKNTQGFFLRQKAIQRQDVRAQAPGIGWEVSSGMEAGQGILSNWEFGSYLQAICRVAFNLNGLLPKPLYDTASAAIVDVSGGSAGLKYAQKSVLQITFRKNSDSGDTAAMTIYLKKGFGIVGMESLEFSNPGGIKFFNSSVFRLFINDGGGTGVGNGASSTVAELAELARKSKECKEIAGAVWENDSACRGKEIILKDGETCFGDSSRLMIGAKCYEVIDLP